MLVPKSICYYCIQDLGDGDLSSDIRGSCPNCKHTVLNVLIVCVDDHDGRSAQGFQKHDLQTSARTPPAIHAESPRC